MAAWTKLEGTQIWKDAQAAHEIPAGRHYHNMSHVRRLYHHAAATFEMPYCADLDHAILVHDVVYNGRHDDVALSVQWLEGQRAGNPVRKSLVMSTLTHEPCADNRLIILDLADFIYPRISLLNTEKLAREAFAMKGTSRREFLEGASRYLTALSITMQQGSRASQDHMERNAFRRISGGMSIVVSEIRRDLEGMSACGAGGNNPAPNAYT